MSNNDLLDRYKACMILSAVGDALGYRNGIWQFNSSGKDIHREFYERFRDFENIQIQLPEWCVSDDTVLHLTISKVLVEYGNHDPSEALYSRIVKEFKNIINELKKRHPNSNTMYAIDHLSENNWFQPYSAISHDCGAAARSMAIGLRYSQPEEFEKLMNVSIEISHMTHTHLYGFMGGFVSALFTSYAIQEKPIKLWINSLLDILPNVKDYIQSQQRFDSVACMKIWKSFEAFWKEFLNKQDTNIEDIEQRDEFYRQFSYAGWAGASGIDCIAIAYNSLLTSNGSWSELCKRSALHGGHGDATGCIATAWFGIVYGFKNVPKENYQNIEFHDDLENAAKKLFDLRQKFTELKEKINSQQGACVHFRFVPSDILDNMPIFREWLLLNHQKDNMKTNVLSNLVIQDLKIN